MFPKHGDPRILGMNLHKSIGIELLRNVFIPHGRYQTLVQNAILLKLSWNPATVGTPPLPISGEGGLLNSMYTRVNLVSILNC